MLWEGFGKFTVSAFLPRKLSFSYLNDLWVPVSGHCGQRGGTQLDLRAIISLPHWEGACVAAEISDKCSILDYPQIPCFRG